MVRLTILDGADSVGGTKILLSTSKGRFLLDFGLNYKRYGLFFEEFLTPRSARGVADLLLLGLLPPACDLYRKDLLPLDFRMDGPPLEVEAIFITHPHLDHCGVLGTVRPEIPAFASPAAWAVLKAMQDTGADEFYQQCVYVVPREPDGERAVRTKSYKFAPAQGRAINFIGGKGTASLREFLSRPPSQSGRDLNPGRMADFLGVFCGMEVRAFPVDHSIPGALAFAFETEGGWVVYTGDLRLHGKDGRLTTDFVKQVRALKPTVLIIEGTRARDHRKGNTTEEEVQERAYSIISKSTGKLVVADFSTRHVERLSTFLEIAESTGRRLALLPKDIYLLEALAFCGDTEDILRSTAWALYDALKLSPSKWEQDVRSRYADRLVGPKEVRANPGDYILAMGFYDMNNLLDLEPTGGIYIYSSSEAHSEEQAYDMRRLWNWLKFLGMEAHGFAVKDQLLHFEPGLHSSGHASSENLLWIIREIRPKHLVPVHTEAPRFFNEELRGEPVKVHLLRNGETFYL